ncbi:MAG: M20/M25/M40 family metallo-hydrolase [Woeseiaceae bacterium]|nr:M20/M25/M40 family metallo-hydrolase [Woeseiaceae bacterium]
MTLARNRLFSLSRTITAALIACLSASVAAQSGIEANVAIVEESVDTYRQAHEGEILGDFIQLLSLPNDAVDPADLERNADHIIGLLEPRGFTTQRLHAGGAPYLFAELNSPGATETILIYAHFDGQPVQEENWAYPPYSPTLLDGPVQAGAQVIDIDKVRGPYLPEWRLYARSAGDDKMPIIALVHTLDALAQNGIELSVNLKLLLDGEEERGSPTVGRIIDENKALFEADLFLFCDGPMHQSRRTQLVFGVRGSTTVDITSYGAVRPLHSGHYGNWAPNPIMQLSYLLTSMRSESGQILIDGYYDDVAPLGELERDAIAAMPDVTEMLKDELAVHTPEGDGRRLEELITLPAINSRGIVAGGVGDKGRNVILSSATTSLDLRLVPDQTPQRAVELIKAHLIKQGFHVVSEDPTDETLRSHPKVAKLDWDETGYPAMRTALDHPMSQRLTRLMRLIAPDLIVTPNMGGSLPLHEFSSRLSAPIIVLPLANHDNNQHAENENIRLQNIWDAMTVYGAILASFGDVLAP